MVHANWTVRHMHRTLEQGLPVTHPYRIILRTSGEAEATLSGTVTGETDFNTLSFDQRKSVVFRSEGPFFKADFQI